MKQIAVISMDEKVIITADLSPTIPGARTVWSTSEELRAICTDDQIELRPTTHGSFTAQADVYVNDAMIASKSVDVLVLVLPHATLNLNVKVLPYTPAPATTLQAGSIDGFTPGQMG